MLPHIAFVANGFASRHAMGEKRGGERELMPGKKSRFTCRRERLAYQVSTLILFQG